MVGAVPRVVADKSFSPDRTVVAARVVRVQSNSSLCESQCSEELAESVRQEPSKTWVLAPRTEVEPRTRDARTATAAVAVTAPRRKDGDIPGLAD